MESFSPQARLVLKERNSPSRRTSYEAKGRETNFEGSSAGPNASSALSRFVMYKRQLRRARDERGRGMGAGPISSALVTAECFAKGLARVRGALRSRSLF